MNKETLRMQMLAGVITEGEYAAIINKEIEEADKASLNESMIGGIVGIGAINQIPSRAKTDYELAFEHFLGERYEVKPNRERDDIKEVEDDMPEAPSHEETDAAQVYEEEVEEGKEGKMYFHVLEDGGYGEIGWQGAYDTEEEAQNKADLLSDRFPDSSFYVEASDSEDEPYNVTMEEVEEEVNEGLPDSDNIDELIEMLELYISNLKELKITGPTEEQDFGSLVNALEEEIRAFN
jgi:hypothetical protein